MTDAFFEVRYRLVVVLVGIAVAIGLPVFAGSSWIGWQGPVFFLFLIVAAELVYIPLPFGGLNVTFAVLLPLFMFYGAAVAVPVYAAGNFAGLCFFRHRPFPASLFNASQLGLSTLCGSLVYWAVTGEPVIATGPGLAAQPLGIGAFVLAFLVVNHAFVQISFALQRDTRSTPRQLLSRVIEPLKWDLLVRVLTTPLGVLLAWLYSGHGVVGATVIVVPLLSVAYIFRLHLSLATANRELTILYDVAQKVGSVLQLEKLFDLVAESVERVARYDVCSLYLWDEIKQELCLVMIKHPTPEIFEGASTQLGQGIVGAVALNREPEIVNDAMKDPRVVYHPDDRFPPRSLLVVPLIVEDDLVGAITVGHNSPGAFSTDHLRMLTILSSQAAVAIENAILYRRTEQLAITDPMTGLFNYRYFYVKLGDELKKARLLGGTLSLIYLDLDEFKRHNDTYGHPTGDRILREFADILRDSIRDADTPVRYAGDEFVVLLAGTDIVEASVVAERIRRAVNQRRFLSSELDGGIKLTVSVGVSNYPRTATTEAEMICRADQAMYLGKQRGMNQVAIAPDSAPP